jgi:hypothetical protein
MTQDNAPDPKTEKGRAALSALAGIGRGCPFCGRREKAIRDTGTTQVECKGCGARGPSCKTGDDKGDDLLRALTAWNERQGEGGLLEDRQRNTVQ